MFTSFLYYCNSEEESALLDILYALDTIVECARSIMFDEGLIEAPY